MSNKANKPQWLIDAEKAITKSSESKFGKMTDKEMRDYERRASGGRAATSIAMEKGTHNFLTMTKEERSKNAKEAGVFKNSELQKELSNRSHAKRQATGYYKREDVIERNAANAKKLDVEWTCEHCGTDGRGIGNLKRYGHHNGSCMDPNKDTIRPSTRKSLMLFTQCFQINLQ